MFFKRYIEGLWVVAEGAVYQLFGDNSDDYIIDLKDYNFDNLMYINIGIDVGETESGTAFTATGFEKNYAGIVALDADWIKGNALTDPTALYEAFHAFLARQQYDGVKVKAIYFDKAQQFLKRGLVTYLSSKGINIQVYDSLKYPINDRIMVTNALFSTYKLKISTRCPHLIKAFKEAVWKANTTPMERLDDFTSDIDSLDSFEYSIEDGMYNIVTFLQKPKIRFPKENLMIKLQTQRLYE